MKTKKLRLIGVALLVLVTITVGVLVWPTPKEAMAVPVTYKVFVWTDFPDPITPVTDAWIEFRFDDGDGWDEWEQPDSEGNGWYKFTRPEGYAVHWQVVLGNANYDPVDPDERFYQPPDTWNSFNWQVD